MLVAGTAAAVGLAYLNDRSRQGGALSGVGFRPAMAEAAGSAATAGLPSTRGRFTASREAVARRAGHATIVGLVAIGVVALAALMIPVAIAVAGSVFRSTPTEAAQTFGPPAELRAAASAPSGWADSYAAAVPSASDRGAALIAGAQQQQTIDTLLNIYKWAETEKAYQAAQAAKTAQAAGAPARGAATSLGRASGYAPGTRLYARITMYGCVGSGGGFCGGMASGITVFEGAAACSSDMPFGTKFTIEGDPTGRTYECLDRGHLSSPWVDVFFYNTADGFAWAGFLGGTHANITIVN